MQQLNRLSKLRIGETSERTACMNNISQTLLIISSEASPGRSVSKESNSNTEWNE
jgi:hypothetical protein